MGTYNTNRGKEEGMHFHTTAMKRSDPGLDNS